MSNPQPMRRPEREIVDQAGLEAVLDEAQVLTLALRSEPAPYVVPVCFGRSGDTLFVHSAAVGTKIDLLRANPVVGFCVFTDMVVRAGETACDYSSTARSVIGTGRASILTDVEERRRGLDAIMRHYVRDAGHSPVYKPGTLSRTAVIAIHIDTLRGKQTG